MSGFRYCSFWSEQASAVWRAVLEEHELRLPPVEAPWYDLAATMRQTGICDRSPKGLTNALHSLVPQWTPPAGLGTLELRAVMAVTLLTRLIDQGVTPITGGANDAGDGSDDEDSVDGLPAAESDRLPVPTSAPPSCGGDGLGEAQGVEAGGCGEDDLLGG